MVRAVAFLAALALFASPLMADGLTAERLGVLFNLDDSEGRALANYYAGRRAIPVENLLGLHMGRDNVIAPAAFTAIRDAALAQLPSRVQSLALVWSRPFAVGCMSVTTAFAAGYRDAFCEPGCGLTAPNPLFDTPGWLPADTVGWWPAMLLPTEDPALARALIDRGIRSDETAPRGIAYLVHTMDSARNVRAATYPEVEENLKARFQILDLNLPITEDLPNAMAYFTGAMSVAELKHIAFLPGAVADHLTSTGGVLYGGNQMSAIAWLEQGATASFGSVSEPCNHLEKFPNIRVLLVHYLRGETVLEAYWKSLAMPGQGLLIGEPLARPFRVPKP